MTMIKYPKNVLQAIMLLIFGFITLLPLIAINELHIINIPKEIFNHIMFLLYFLGIVLFYTLKNKGTASFISFFKTGDSFNAIAYIIICLLVMIFQVGINVPLAKFISYHFSKTNNITNPLNDIYTVLASIILAPFCEEIIFRGIILRGFLVNYNFKVAILLSAIIFCVFHINPSQLIGALILGLFLGYIYGYTKNLFTTIIFHSLSNLISVLTALLLFQTLGIGRADIIYGKWTLLTVGFSVILVGCLIYLLHAFVKKKCIKNV
ncbi:lysostaphin resistance A-like protein [Pedobacter sp. N23S346]|uniref:CPBP family intramembrane glutamic endopeptidase n=1 Tax=Pedobacter sp. N23S346 TaxID=3402750 RepID=UPI003AD7A753